jgi:hypothetical protein
MAMTADAIGAGTINRLAELRTGGGPTLSVYLDLETETLSTSDAHDAPLGCLDNEPGLPHAHADITTHKQTTHQKRQPMSGTLTLRCEPPLPE